MSRPSEDWDWLTLRSAGKVIQRSPGVVKKLAARGVVRTQTLPGLPPRYSREDIEALARDSVKRAGEGGPPR